MTHPLDYPGNRRISGGRMGGLLEGKKVLVTGVLDRRSIAFSVAGLAVEQGAEIALSSFGKAMNLTARTAKRLDPEPPVLTLDVNEPEDIEAVAEDLKERWGELDAMVHAIAFAPEDALGGNFLTAEWPSVATALQTSAYSLTARRGSGWEVGGDCGHGALTGKPRGRRVRASNFFKPLRATSEIHLVRRPGSRGRQIGAAACALWLAGLLGLTQLATPASAFIVDDPLPLAPLKSVP